MYDYGSADANRDHYGVVSGQVDGLLSCVHLCVCVCVCVGGGGGGGGGDVHVT